MEDKILEKNVELYCKMATQAMPMITEKMLSFIRATFTAGYKSGYRVAITGTELNPELEKRYGENKD